MTDVQALASNREEIRTMDVSGLDVFSISEPLYDVCESWAEEPEPLAWDLLYPQIRVWLIRSN